MTELRLANDSGADSARTERSRIGLWLVLAAGAATMAIIALSAYVWRGYSAKWGKVDHSADFIQIHSLPPSTVSATAEARTVTVPVETTYRNARSGVTLKLPGVWNTVKAPGIAQPDMAHRFCILSSSDGLDLMFWPQFPDFLPSLDTEAAFFIRRFTSKGFSLQSQRQITVRGKQAKELEFTAQKYGGLKLDLVVIRKWPVLYLVAITGPPELESGWKSVEDALPETVDID